MAAVHISARASSLSTRHFAARPASKFLRVILGVKPDLEQVLASLPPPHLYVLEATISKISAFHRGLPSTPRRSAPSAVPGPNLVETDAPFVPDHEVWRTLGPDRVRWWSSLPSPLFCKDLELLLASPPGGGEVKALETGPSPPGAPYSPHSMPDETRVLDYLERAAISEISSDQRASGPHGLEYADSDAAAAAAADRDYRYDAHFRCRAPLNCEPSYYADRGFMFLCGCGCGCGCGVGVGFMVM